jgi:hypothetical protein
MIEYKVKAVAIKIIAVEIMAKRDWNRLLMYLPIICGLLVSLIRKIKTKGRIMALIT